MAKERQGESRDSKVLLQWEQGRMMQLWRRTTVGNLYVKGIWHGKMNK